MSAVATYNESQGAEHQTGVPGIDPASARGHGGRAGPVWGHPGLTGSYKNIYRLLQSGAKTLLSKGIIAMSLYISPGLCKIPKDQIPLREKQNETKQNKVQSPWNRKGTRSCPELALGKARLGPVSVSSRAPVVPLERGRYCLWAPAGQFCRV